MSIRTRPNYANPVKLCKCSKLSAVILFQPTLHDTHTLITFVFSYGAERFEDGASQINKSDMFFGDDGDISEEELKHMDEVTMKNVKFVKMTEGDVVLLDNYKCMHGRNVFDGTRKHGVAWFEGWEGEEEMKKSMASSKSSQSSKKIPFFVTL